MECQLCLLYPAGRVHVLLQQMASLAEALTYASKAVYYLDSLPSLLLHQQREPILCACADLSTARWKEASEGCKGLSSGAPRV